jgi:hypothetical protein
VESPPSKRRILKKRKREREEQGLKGKRGDTSFEKLHVSKKEQMKFVSCWKRFYQKKERSHFPIVQNPMCGLIHTHTSFAFALHSIP